MDSKDTFIKASTSSSSENEIHSKRPRKQGRVWTVEEDQKLLKAVELIDNSNWVEIAKFVGTRSRKQCRERYINHVCPTIDRREWTKEEDDIIVNMYKSIGGKWCQINKMLIGRTARAVRNRYKSLCSKTTCQSCFNLVECHRYVVYEGGMPW